MVTKLGTGPSKGANRLGGSACRPEEGDMAERQCGPEVGIVVHPSDLPLANVPLEEICPRVPE